MALLHGQSMLRAVQQLLVLFALSANLTPASPWKEVLRRGVDICKVKAQSGAGGADEGLRVVALPGNMRAVAFGKADDVETTVTCAAQDGDNPREALPAGCSAWAEDQEPVSDVSQCPSCPCVQDTSKGLESSSNNMIFEEGIQPACVRADSSTPVDVLLFGMGGGAVQTYAMQKCPAHTRVESVEADPRMAAVATKFFGVPTKDGISVVHVDDASTAAASFADSLNQAASGLQEQSAGQKQRSLRQSEKIAALGKKQWDVVATDCFVDHGVTPESCRSREFLTYLRLLVRPGGTVLHHMWHTSPYDDSVAPTFDDTVQLYKDIFGEDKVFVRQVPREKDAQWDSIIFIKG